MQYKGHEGVATRELHKLVLPDTHTSHRDNEEASRCMGGF